MQKQPQSRYERNPKTGKLVVKRAVWEKEWAVCPKCKNKGKGLGNCTQCYGRGYVRR